MKIREKLILIPLIVLIITVVVSYSFYHSNKALVTSQQWVRHTDNVIQQSASILSIANALEASSTSFVITNDSAFIQPKFMVQTSTAASLAVLSQLVTDNPLQKPNVDSLSYYMHNLIDHAYQSIHLRSTAGFAAAVDNESTTLGKSHIDHIKAITSLIQDREQVLLTERLMKNRSNTNLFNLFSITMFLIMIAGNFFLVVFIRKNLMQNEQKENREAELVIANKVLIYENIEKGKRAAELIIANGELIFENEEKVKRAGELIIANKALAYENKEKGKRAAELAIANDELIFENEEKVKRAGELIIANKALAYENKEKGKRAAELVIANKDLVQSQEIANYGNFELNYTSGKTVWSEQLCKIFGILNSKKDCTYDCLLSYIHHDDCKDVTRILQGNNTANSNTNFYHRIIRKDNTIKHLHTWQRIAYNDEGQPLSMHLVVHDITEQATNIMQLKAQNTQLQEIAWLQSHKVRGPLSTILGLSQLFKEHLPEMNIEEIIEGILSSSKKLDNVIREIVSKTDPSNISNPSASAA